LIAGDYRRQPDRAELGQPLLAGTNKEFLLN
jgi:hypothetical protein